MSTSPMRAAAATLPLAAVLLSGCVVTVPLRTRTGTPPALRIGESFPRADAVRLGSDGRPEADTLVLRRVRLDGVHLTGLAPDGRRVRWRLDHVHTLTTHEVGIGRTVALSVPAGILAGVGVALGLRRVGRDCTRADREGGSCGGILLVGLPLVPAAALAVGLGVSALVPGTRGSVRYVVTPVPAN